MDRVYLDLAVKALEGDQRIITGIASTIQTDRMNDIVVPRGAAYTLPIPLLHQHDHNSPIGHVTAAEVTDTEIRVTAKLVHIDEPGPLKDRIDGAWQMLKAGLVRGLSIGFNPIEVEPIRGGGTKYKRWSWLELSTVVIPANAGAGILAVKAADLAARGAGGPLTFGGVLLTKAEQHRLAESVAGAALEYFGPKIREHDEALAEFLKIVRGMHDAQQALADELARLRRRI